MKMKLKITIFLVIGIVVGFVAGRLLPKTPSVDEHWRIVREFRAYVLDPANYTPDPQTGLSVAEAPNVPLSSLAALVSAGELNHIDIVLPMVPYKNRDANRFWMDFCSKHDGIIDASGNPIYVAFPTKGDQPLRAYA